MSTKKNQNQTSSTKVEEPTEIIKIEFPPVPISQTPEAPVEEQITIEAVPGESNVVYSNDGLPDVVKEQLEELTNLTFTSNLPAYTPEDVAETVTLESGKKWVDTIDIQEGGKVHVHTAEDGQVDIFVERNEVTPQLVEALVMPVATEEELYNDVPNVIPPSSKYKFASNGALRNLHSINDRESTNQPVLAQQSAHKTLQPASVKSVQGNRSGMFKINPDRPIRN